MATPLFEQIIAGQMEQLSRLGIDHLDDFRVFAEKITACLLNGGKIIVINDTESDSWAAQLTHLLAFGDRFERPILPAIKLSSLCNPADTKHATTVLRGLVQAEDCLLLVSRTADFLLPLSHELSNSCFTVSQGHQRGDSDSIVFRIDSRREWYSALNVLSNFLERHLEYVLFGQ